MVPGNRGRSTGRIVPFGSELVTAGSSPEDHHAIPVRVADPAALTETVVAARLMRGQPPENENDGGCRMRARRRGGGGRGGRRGCCWSNIIIVPATVGDIHPSTGQPAPPKCSSVRSAAVYRAYGITNVVDDPQQAGLAVPAALPELLQQQPCSSTC